MEIATGLTSSPIVLVRYQDTAPGKAAIKTRLNALIRNRTRYTGYGNTLREHKVRHSMKLVCDLSFPVMYSDTNLS